MEIHLHPEGSKKPTGSIGLLSSSDIYTANELGRQTIFMAVSGEAEAGRGAIYASAIVIRDSSAGTALYEAIQAKVLDSPEPTESDSLDPLLRDAINSAETSDPNQLIQAVYRVKYGENLGTIDTEDEFEKVAAMLFNEGSYMIYVSEDPNLTTFRRVKP